MLGNPEHVGRNYVNPYQPSVEFDMEISHLICTANQITGFYEKCNIWLKWVKLVKHDDETRERVHWEQIG